MAAVGSRARSTEISKKWKEKETSPERNIVWTEPKSQKSGERKVPVVYYLCRNGQLEHPHFMEVPLSSTDGLYLRDVINRLNTLRGKGMATMYSWSSKRSYRNGFVWHDLSENDFIYPAHGQEYVLKGSEILDDSVNPTKAIEAVSSFRLPESQKSETDSDFPASRRRRNQSWSSIDLNEYKVYKNELSSESTRRLAADASTQTEDKRRRRKPVKEAEIEELEEGDSSQSQSQELEQNHTTELSREEISPPPSDSSPETLETLMQAEGRLRLAESGSIVNNENGLNQTADGCTSGRMKASTVLMQLISCGSISFRDGPERDQRFSLLGQYKSRLPRGAGNNTQVIKESGTDREIGRFARVKLEDKEYFSGSLIETKKQEVPPALKRSSSYNADRTSQMQLAETELDEVHAKCIARKPKALPVPIKKEENTGSKRFIS